MTEPKKAHDLPTTADFEKAGLPFEAFLCFAQMSDERQLQVAERFWEIYGDKVGGAE